MDCKPGNESFNWFGGFSQEDEDGIVPYMKWVLNKMKKMVEECMIDSKLEVDSQEDEQKHWRSIIQSMRWALKRWESF